MPNLVGTESDLLHLLEKLIELDYDAIEAYQAAIERLEDTESRQHLQTFMEDHVRHTQNLGRVMSDAGRKPPVKGDMKRALTKGKVQLASLVGDKAILQAMKTNEDDTNQAYERAVERQDTPATVRELLRQNLSDERAHRRWIEQKVESLS